MFGYGSSRAAISAHLKSLSQLESFRTCTLAIFCPFFLISSAVVFFPIALHLCVMSSYSSKSSAAHAYGHGDGGEDAALTL